MSTIYLQMIRLSWRWLIATAGCFILFTASLATYQRSNSVLRASNAHSELVDSVLNTTLGFQKIFAVSLPERTDHRDGLALASAVSNIQFEFVDGVHGDAVPDKALPLGEHKNLRGSTIGSWRAHLNAIASVVHDNYTSALIIEDDVDWDVRIKSLLRDFARSSHALAHNPEDGVHLELDKLPPGAPPSISPYGDDWDLLWLGHCGMQLPNTGAVIHNNDPTVPEPQHLHSWDASESTPLHIYPPHTRVVMRKSNTPVCSLAYAVSQKGARSLLYHLGLRRLDAPYDVMLRAWCHGSDGNEAHVCPGVLPQLFDHYRRAGPKSRDSDISDPSPEIREKAETLNIRWSVRMNLEKMVRGDTDYDDQYPDTP